MEEKCKQFAINAHASTNHMYDTYLPYEFHLRMVVKNAKDFDHLVPEAQLNEVLAACWLHDTIEDCRVNYNDILKLASPNVAEMVRACTNYSRGRNRAERMPHFCYDDLTAVPYAKFVKLCDRIANVQYSKMTNSGMFDKYKSEHKEFREKLEVHNDPYASMFDYLESILN